jgi:hypothetical protein
VRKQALQRGHRLFGAVLLPEREGAVDHDHRNDGSRERGHSLTWHPPIRDQRQNCCSPQQGGEEVGELAEEAKCERRSRESLDAVGPEFEPSSRGLDL